MISIGLRGGFGGQQGVAKITRKPFVDSFSGTVNVINLKLCIMPAILFIELDVCIQVSTNKVA